MTGRTSFDLTGRRALVTGAGRGIGAAIAFGLAEAGADVVVHFGQSADEAAHVATTIRALGRRATTIAANLTDPRHVNGLIDETVAFLGGLDVLVSNAGHLVARVPVAEMAEAHFQRVLDVNLVSTFRVCRAALSHLSQATDGRVIMLAAQAAHNGGGKGVAAYAAAKGGVVSFAKALAKEVAARGITVNAIAPGFIGGTSFHDTFTAPDKQRRIVARQPIARAGTADDVASAAVFLASGEARFITGATIDIDGGRWPR
ncbi:SDR family oxidoreductase [Solwaraspora sp. WMMD406]|uniref:SDR family NAD(P)-dependent oxidoreductase n=1 Tax=Solwaraspora sp. WMMD406 TaxID=3016095 RepID=UPI00241695D5|nr:SDR family oxidoreductase [Solwaraspora sp. WMMD406]MDG4763012.1 SDR family oxidoreductase [Solwaraspora sp. WMMD406]